MRKKGASKDSIRSTLIQRIIKQGLSAWFRDKNNIEKNKKNKVLFIRFVFWHRARAVGSLFSSFLTHCKRSKCRQCLEGWLISIARAYTQLGIPSTHHRWPRKQRVKTLSIHLLSNMGWNDDTVVVVTSKPNNSNNNNNKKQKKKEKRESFVGWCQPIGSTTGRTRELILVLIGPARAIVVGLARVYNLLFSNILDNKARHVFFFVVSLFISVFFCFLWLLFEKEKRRKERLLGKDHRLDCTGRKGVAAASASIDGKKKKCGWFECARQKQIGSNNNNSSQLYVSMQ